MERFQTRLILFLVIFSIFYKKSSSTSTKKPKKKLYDHGNRLELTEPGFDLTEEEMKKFKIWPKGIIPFYIDDISFDKILREKLRSLLGSFNIVTGLRFTEIQVPPMNQDERYVFFINRRGQLTCEDYTTSSFNNTGVQRIVLGYDCLGAGGGALAAMVLALAGVPPQHNAPDRDDHIDVVMDNIIREKRDLFKKMSNKEWLFHQVPYDFVSAGHYNFHKYSMNGSATIIPKEEDYIHVPIGEADGISPKDILKIRMLYNFISKTRKKTKASDCSQIFKPGTNFDNFEPPDEDIIIPRHKPSKYLGVSNEKLKNKNQNSQENRSPNESKKRGAQKLKVQLSKKKRKIGKDKLAYKNDFDTDDDGYNKNKRNKLSGKVRGLNVGKKMKNALSKHKMNKLHMYSDVDTDNAG